MPLHLDFSERVDEFVDGHEAAADSDLDVVGFVDLEKNTTLAELVDALRLPEEEYLHPLLLRVLVEVICQDHVCLVLFVSDVNMLDVILLGVNLFY